MSPLPPDQPVYYPLRAGSVILNGSKIAWHLDRVQAWERGERIRSPSTWR